MKEKELLEKANVLLISNAQEDYDGLIDYGFQNVDYFKSHICAERYFEEYKEELKKYHIVLTSECDWEPLESKIKELKSKNGILVMRIIRGRYVGGFTGVSKSKLFSTNSYQSLLKFIISYAIEKNILGTAQVTKRAFPINKKSLKEKELLISKNENGITGSWMREGKWISDIDITSLHLENYPFIVERLEIEGNLILGSLKNTNIYYAILMYFKENVLSSEQYVTGYDIEEILIAMNNRLIETSGYQNLGR